jgi:hypothetical protein
MRPLAFDGRDRPVALRRDGKRRARARLAVLLVVLLAALAAGLLLTRGGPAADCTHGESSISVDFVDGRPIVTGPEQTGCRIPREGPQVG